MTAERTLAIRRECRCYAVLALFFFAAHSAYWIAGVRFNDLTLIEVMHFLDTESLRHKLLESIWYLHIQPPLMNFFTGLVLKVSAQPTGLFLVLFVCMGLTLYLGVYTLQRQWGVPRTTAAVTSTLFMASPSFILWEHLLLYTLPCAALLCIAAVALKPLVRSAHPGAAAIFFGALFLLCGTRSMFHFGYFVLVLVVVCFLCRRRWRTILAVAALPLVVLFGFYFKNLMLFGEFTVCTFVEKNLWIMTAGNMPWETKKQWVREGRLSELSLINRWDSLDAYPLQFKEAPNKFAGIDVLNKTHKANGSVNYNHYGNIEICNIYGDDARYVLRHYPRTFVLSTAQSVYRYFMSSSALPVTPENKMHMEGIMRLYDRLIYGKLPIDPAKSISLVRQTGVPPHIFLILGLPFLWAYAVWSGIPGATRYDRAQRAVFLFCALNIAVVVALGCTFDFLETARYRFMTDGLSVALLGAFISHALSWNRTRRNARTLADS
ncbi:MAG: hypothetical protein HYV27_13275 [Candidatus Hydrogenedentes bacterium]|nr:hypothetical protein [Candidatus Hydrogenedentota bacterium]